MTRYYFDFEFTGGGYFDHEGSELADDAAAIAHAETDARHIIGDLLRHDRVAPHRIIVVRNSDREIGRVYFADIAARLARQLREAWRTDAWDIKQ
jgi:hypothetical protein